jgi:hypothetical protein
VTSLADSEPAEEPHQEALLRLSERTEAGTGGASQTAASGSWAPARWLDQPKHRKILGWSIFALAVAAYLILFGIPYSADVILLWVAAALFVSTIEDSRNLGRTVIKDWLPLYLVLALYALLRGYASDTLWGPFVRPQVWFDTHVFGGVAPTVQLQRWLFNPHQVSVLDYGVWFTYTTHFFASFVIAGVLWKVDYRRFRRFVALFVGLTLLGYVTYVLYPAMPPWLASQTGHLPPTTRIVPFVWSHLGVHQAAALFTGGNRFDNNIAAMPSLHAAYPMLICLFFWSRANRWFRALLVAYVLAMAFTLVYAGEHFVLDELVGWTYAIVVFVVGSRLLHRWEARRGRPRADHDARNGDTRAEALHAPLTRATAATND